MNKITRLRIGILGAGRIVEQIHMPILCTLPAIHVMGVFDPNKQKAIKLAHQFGIPSVAHTFDDLLHLAPDCLLIACPNVLHAEMSIAALEAGIHVICEKPMATSFSDAQRMVAAAEQTGQSLMIAFNNRFRPDVLALQHVIQSGAIGQVMGIRCEWLRRAGIPGSWFVDRSLSGGGVLTDLGSHVINVALSLIGAQQLLTTCGVIDYTVLAEKQAAWYLPDTTELKQICNVEISADAVAIFSDAIHLSIAVSWACDVPLDRTCIDITGTEGTAHLKTLFGLSPHGARSASPLTICSHGETITPIIEQANNVRISYENQWKAFIENILRGQSMSSHLYESLSTVQVIEAIYHSAVIKPG